MFNYFSSDFDSKTLGASAAASRGKPDEQRKPRRGDLDQRYEYIFSVLSYFIGMHRMEILDNLLEGDQVGQTQ
jgi:hypothetical protein